MMPMDRTRAFGSWFLLAAAAYFLLYINGVSYMLSDPYSDALMVFEFGGGMGFAAPLMPLIAALPFATSFVSDYVNGYCPPVVLRSGKDRYLRSKALFTALSGGAATAGGMFLFVLLINLLFPQDTGSPLLRGGASDLSLILQSPGPLPLLLFYLARLFLQFMAGAWWAMSALAFSAFYPNLPLTLCAPLIFYRLLGWLMNLPFMPVWLNVTWLDDGQLGLLPWQTLLAGLLVFGGLTAVAALVFRWRAGRRLSYA